MSETARTRKNNISKTLRIQCFLAALPDFLKEAEKRKPVKVETTWKQERLK